MRSYTLQVNHPLRVDDVRVYLIGHGYAPTFRITDGRGYVFSMTVPFIPVDETGLTSEGVIKVPDASPDQLGFAGVFLPTAVDQDGRLSSVFPAALDPRVSLVAYAGNLGENSGPPQSVYQLNTAQLRRLPVAPVPLSPGQSMKLPGGAGTLTFTGYKQWISLEITYDPGQIPALISGIAALAGLILSFMVRRRRVFVRAYPGPGGTTTVDVGGLARSDAAGGSEAEFAEIAAELRNAHQGSPAAASGPAGAGETLVSDPPGAGDPAAPASLSANLPADSDLPAHANPPAQGQPPLAAGHPSLDDSEGE
jgi:cytochrome c biogenesis protein